jgi:hypothetical protein
MAIDNAKGKPKAQIFECVSVPVPPGKKTQARLWRPGDPEPSAARMWWLVGAAVTGALGVGVLIGRFVLP